MRVNFAILLTLLRTELRMVLRDRRILVAAVFLPLLIMPVMFFGANWSMKQRREKVEAMSVRYALTGPRATDAAHMVETTRARLARKGATNEILQEIETTEPLQLLNQGQLEVVIEAISAADATSTNAPGSARSDAAHPPSGKSSSNKKTAPAELHSLPPDTLVLRLTGRSDRDVSSSAVERLRLALEETREQRRGELLLLSGFPAPPGTIAQVKTEDLASQAQVAGLALGRMMTLLLLLFVLTGGTVVATDLLAGEKERGTLETLLTTGAGRLEIVLAKHLTVLGIGMLIALIQSMNLLVYIGFKLVTVPGSLAAAATPGTAALVLVLFLPVAALAASVLLLVSGKARSYKEAQLYFFPVFMIGLAPALAPFLPGLPLNSAIVLAPIAGIAVAVKEVLIGSFEWPMIAVAWLSTALPAAWLTSISVRNLSAENLISSNAPESTASGNRAAAFQNHIWRWFALMWALLIIVSSYLERVDLRLQLFVNLVCIFLAVALILLRVYRLNPREVLALRAPKPAVWLGTLIAAPGGTIAAVGLFKLANVFLPVPPKMLEAFNQNVLPDSIPFWQLLLFLTLLPGVLEEITFRGILLHGLRDRLHPIALALVVGIVFGLFHVTLFRFVPTAYLGFLLAIVTLLTGSIFPAMLWHTINNLLGLLAAKYNSPITELDPGGYLIGVSLLATGLWIIWRHRTPYPGIRRWISPRIASGSRP